MFVVGLQLTPDDFRRVLVQPRAAIGGTLAQIVLLPLMTLVLVQALELSPSLAVGALFLAGSPGGGSSNVAAAVAKANVALSVTLTAVTSLLCVVTLPLLTAFGMPLFLSGSVQVEVPVLAIIVQLTLCLALPIGLGMWVGTRYPEATARYITRANRFILVALLLLTVAGAVGSSTMLPANLELGVAVLAAIVWTFCAVVIGYVLGRVLRLSPDDRFTLVIEFGARNGALTVIVALSAMQSLDFALLPVVYAIAGGPLVLLCAVARGWWLNRREANTP